MADKTATDLLRAAVRQRPLGTAKMATEIQCVKDHLHSFAFNNGPPLAPEKMAALTALLFGGHIAYEAAQDLLRSTNTAPAQPMGAPPAPYEGKPVPTTGGVNLGQQKPKAKRAGWVE